MCELIISEASQGKDKERERETALGNNFEKGARFDALLGEWVFGIQLFAFNKDLSLESLRKTEFPGNVRLGIRDIPIRVDMYVFGALFVLSGVFDFDTHASVEFIDTLTIEGSDSVLTREPLLVPSGTLVLFGILFGPQALGKWMEQIDEELGNRFIKNKGRGRGDVGGRDHTRKEDKEKDKEKKTYAVPRVVHNACVVIGIVSSGMVDDT